MSGSPTRLRRLHERWVFDRLRRGGSASRAELAKETGLSAPTVGKVVDALLAQGLVEEVIDDGQAREAGVGGRPARPVDLCRSRPSIIALQLGVRHTRLAALPVAGPEDEHWPLQFKTPASRGTWLRHLREAAKRLNIHAPRVVIVSTPGVVDERAGRVLLAPNLHWTETTDLPADVGGIWSCHVGLVQEIRALALGHLEAEPRSEDFLLVDIGEGVGGAAVVRGRLYGGPLAISGEIGHTPVPGNGRLCGCGGVGCLETLISRAGLLEGWLSTSRSAAGLSPSKAWRAMSRSLEQHGVEPWLDERLHAAGAVIAGALNLLGLRRVVVTGVASELPACFVRRLAEWVERSAMWARFGQVHCQAAPRRRAMGLISAAIDRFILPPQSWEAREEESTEPSIDPPWNRGQIVG
ncbi:MAG: ROK family transcriptional regulator [Phycisphaeraceae bacterium]|nr:ROK family transcriptional regulator [Phycisphaeraceae bacterium]